MTFTGRLSDLIKTAGGASVTPGEVESALTACDGIAEAYVVGACDGGAGTVVAAAVVPRAGHDVDADALGAQLRPVLSAYEIPKHIWVAAKSEPSLHRHRKDQKVRARSASGGTDAPPPAGPPLKLDELTGRRRRSDPIPPDGHAAA